MAPVVMHTHPKEKTMVKSMDLLRKVHRAKPNLLGLHTSLEDFIVGHWGVGWVGGGYYSSAFLLTFCTQRGRPPSQNQRLISSIMADSLVCTWLAEPETWRNKL